MGKLKLILALICICLVISNMFFMEKYKSTLDDNKRLEYNLSNINQQIDSVKDKNGELHYTINSLNLKTSELSKVNSNLTEELKNMRIKIKNLQDVSVINTSYNIKQDSVKTEIIYVTDTLNQINKKYHSVIDNEYIFVDWFSTVNNDNLTVTDFNANLNDTIITATEIIYKGWWFWRKPKEIKFHIKSLNPYSNFDKIESIHFNK